MAGRVVSTADSAARTRPWCRRPASLRGGRLEPGDLGRTLPLCGFGQVSGPGASVPSCPPRWEMRRGSCWDGARHVLVRKLFVLLRGRAVAQPGWVRTCLGECPVSWRGSRGGRLGRAGQEAPWPTWGLPGARSPTVTLLGTCLSTPCPSRSGPASGPEEGGQAGAGRRWALGPPSLERKVS